jgi:hypothetical protein
MMGFMKLWHLKMVSGLSFSFIVMFGGNMAIADTERNYYLNFLYQDFLFDLRVNGIPIIKEYDSKGYSVSLPVTEHLKKGKNIIELNYFPFDQVERKKKYTKDFQFSIKIDSIDRNTREEKSISVFDGNYDFVEKQIGKSGFKGLKDSYDVGFMKTSGEIESFSLSTFISSKFKNQESYSLKFYVDVDDDFVNLPFENAVQLEESENLEKTLMDLNGNVYEGILHGRHEYIPKAFGSVWDRSAYYNGYKSSEEFYNSEIRDEWTYDIGKGTLADYDLMPKKRFKVEIIGEGKLARLIPAPIYWIKDIDGELYSVRTISIGFMKTVGGEYKIGYVFTD